MQSMLALLEKIQLSYRTYRNRLVILMHNIMHNTCSGLIFNIIYIYTWLFDALVESELVIIISHFKFAYLLF